MDDELDAALDEAYDNLERDTEMRDEDDFEKLEAAERHWQEMRAQSAPHQPQPHRLATAEQREQSWNAFVDARIVAALGLDPSDAQVVAAFGEGGTLAAALRQTIGELRKEFRRELKAQVATLCYELDKVRAELKTLRRKAATTPITSWYIDKRRYTVTPFFGSRPGPSCDVRQLFQQFHEETT